MQSNPKNNLLSLNQVQMARLIQHNQMVNGLNKIIV